MDRVDRAKVLKKYDERFEKHGYHPLALGWTKGRESLRYHILVSHWDLQSSSVLDYGCGFGDLYGYCQRRGIAVEYAGADINPNIIGEGRRQYPDADLFVADSSTESRFLTYDYIFCSGVFNTRLSDNWRFIREMFAFFRRHCRRGFAANFLSDRVDWELEDSFHADPTRVLALAYEHSNRIVLRNDYMPFEFTVFVDLKSQFDPALAVYPEHEAMVKEKP